MKRLVVLFSVSLLFVGCSSEPEVMIKDKPVSHWANQLSDSDVQKRISAAKILVKAGPDAAGALDALEKAFGDDEIRAFAFRTMENIGDPAIPALGRAFVDDNKTKRKLAKDALMKIGPTTIPVVREALKHQNKLIRQEACVVLKSFGPKAQEAIPDIEPLLNDIDDITQDRAKQALEAIRVSGS